MGRNVIFRCSTVRIAEHILSGSELAEMFMFKGV